MAFFMAARSSGTKIVYFKFSNRKEMLDKFCNGLRDEAQLKLAIHLNRLALPVWNNYFMGRTDRLKEINSLLKNEFRLPNGQARIEADFVGTMIGAIENAYKKHNREISFLKQMRNDPVLMKMLATSMQFLINPQWEQVVPREVRLVFTSAWNSLIWIVHRQRNSDKETHIYVAINQAADALLSCNIKTVDEINEILGEYASEDRTPADDSYWLSLSDEVTADAGLNQEDVYRKILREKKLQDAAELNFVAEVLRQMKEEGRSYWDEWEEYYEGTSKTYFYDKDKQSYCMTEIDVIAASFYNEHPMSEEDMKKFVSGKSLHELRSSGFII